MSKRLRYIDENREVIIRYLEGGGEGCGVVLNDMQKELFKRWAYADELIRDNYFVSKRREIIANLIITKFDVSRDTAYRDMINAEYVFSSSTPLNKKYIIQRRIDTLEVEIHKCYISNEHQSGAMLEKQLREYIKMYPDYQPRKSPKVINYIIQSNQYNTVPAEQAYTEADEIYNELIKDDDLDIEADAKDTEIE